MVKARRFLNSMRFFGDPTKDISPHHTTRPPISCKMAKRKQFKDTEMEDAPSYNGGGATDESSDDEVQLSAVTSRIGGHWLTT